MFSNDQEVNDRRGMCFHNVSSHLLQAQVEERVTDNAATFCMFAWSASDFFEITSPTCEHAISWYGLVTRNQECYH